jgi:rhodanese-related sulfurtransferase
VDGTQPSIPAFNLYGSIGTSTAPLVVDLRSPEDLVAIGRLIPGAIHRSADGIEQWWRELPPSKPVVVYDLSGGDRSQKVVDVLTGYGTYAGFLRGGFIGWYESGLPTRGNVGAALEKWITREHPKIDRIACPWLISRFINPLAEFIYVPPNDVLSVAKETGATPYDIKGVEFGHVGDCCSFDAIMRIFEIDDSALQHLAKIVRGADTSRPDLTPQCEGLLAISHGLSANYPDDHEMLGHGMVIYDALYRWCRLQGETHGSASKATA